MAPCFFSPCLRHLRGRLSDSLNLNKRRYDLIRPRGNQLMRISNLLTVALIVSLFTTLAFGQGGKMDAETARIREQIEQLENQLRSLEKANLGTRRVTTIGGSRAGVRRGGMEIRIYDLGDLFAIAPPYPAEGRSDLIQEAFPQPIFPNVLYQHQATAQGGFGGGGFGGGFFSVDDQRATLGNPPRNRQVLHQLGEGSSAGQSSTLARRRRRFHCQTRQRLDYLRGRRHARPD